MDLKKATKKELTEEIKRLRDENRELKKTTDNWIIDYWLRNSDDAGVAVIEMTPNNFAQPMFEYAKKHKTSTVFHTDRETQKEMAKRLFEIFANIKKEA